MRRQYDSIHEEQEAASERLRVWVEGAEAQRAELDKMTAEERDELIALQNKCIARSKVGGIRG